MESPKSIEIPLTNEQVSWVCGVPPAWERMLEYTIMQLNTNRGAVIGGTPSTIGYFKPDRIDKGLDCMFNNVDEVWLMFRPASLAESYEDPFYVEAEASYY